MRGAKSAVLGAMLGLLAAGEAQAAKTGPKDYFLDPPAAGLWAHGDLLTIGAQAALEHRLELDGDLTMLSTRVSALGALGFGDLGAHVDFRAALLTLGGSAGYRQVWRNYPVPEGVEATSELRRQMDKDAKKSDDEPREAPYERNNKGWPWAEGRARLVIPLERLWLVTNGALRWEGGPDNAYDWFHTNVHDGGTLWRADATLFVRHERYGAVGPTVRYMNLPRHGGRADEVAVGFTLGTRPGLKRNSDLLLVQFLARPGDKEFGFHVLQVPVFAMIIYRVSFGLSLPPRPS